MSIVEPDAAPRPPLLRRTGKLVLIAVVAAAALTLVLAAANVVGGSDRRRSLSTSTSATGLAGYSELLARNGHPITHQPDALDGVPLDRDSTYVLLDAPR